MNAEIMSNRFVAFLDILGFKDIVDSIERQNGPHNPQFRVIKSVLQFMAAESDEPQYGEDLPVYEFEGDAVYERGLGDPRLTYVSDCIVISTEGTIDGFKALSRKIHKVTSDLAVDGIFCRGAISKGLLFHEERIFFGNAYVRAYKLESEFAKNPRVIVDPEIIPFFDLGEGDYPLGPGFFGRDADGYFYQRYWTHHMFPPYIPSWETYLMGVRTEISKKLATFAGKPSVHQKYMWLRSEFNDLIRSWTEMGAISECQPLPETPEHGA